MSSHLDGSEALSWPLTRAHEGLSGIVRHISPPAASVPTPPAANPETLDREALGRWLDTAVAPCHLEAEAVQPDYARLTHFLQHTGPVLLLLPDATRFLLLLSGQRRSVRLLASNGTLRRVPLESVRAILCHEAEAALQPEIDRLLATAVPPQQHARTREAILRRRLHATRPVSGWRLVPSPGASFWWQLRRSGVISRLLAFLTAHTAQYVLFLLSWWLAGRAVLQGDLNERWLLSWAMLLLALIPLRLLVHGLQSSVTIRAGRLLQRRLLHGALSLHPDELRHLGVGQLLGRVFEAETVETLALNGGLLGLMALIELVLAGWVLSQGAAGRLHLFGLLLWLALLAVLAHRLYRRRRQWTAVRRQLTHDLIEKMVGHRTYVAQLPPASRHAGEEQLLAEYTTVSAGMDKAATALAGLAARGWLLVGLAGLLPVFLAGSVEVTAVAISLGGILSAELALRKIGQSFVHLAGAAIAWEQISHLFQAAARSQSGARPPAEPAASPAVVAQPVLALDNLSFTYPGRGLPILRGCTLSVNEGDRLLLSGPSGGGKSTLAAIIAGLRRSQNGSLRFRGQEPQTLPLSAWRRHVVYTPQFHENYVLGSTFLFNLLVGGNWPPRPADVAAATAICQELGLGDLLERMPAGMQQTVGEIGWQLSHGERSRLYMARTLLQGAEVMVFDESFAALDPESMRVALQCVLRHAHTLIVLSHLDFPGDSPQN